MLWLDMGLGKTAITLTSLSHLLASGFLRGVVIVAPIRVCRLVWRQEAAKWSHTKDLRFGMLTGTKDQRTRALLRPADVWLINYENLGWLAETLQTYYVSKGRQPPFNGLVWDEISKCKNSTTQRVKSIMKILDHFSWITGLTGTPASNGYQDLHGQFLVVDRGQRLGTSKTKFMTEWYRKPAEVSRKVIPYKDTEDRIKQLIGDIVLEMSAEDYNPLPDLIVNDIEVEMPEHLRSKYDAMERDFFLQLDNGKTKEVFNQASLTNVCLQFANGAVYPITGMPLWEPVHDLKLDALEELIEEANGQPILCSYAYRSDAERIMRRFAHLNPVNLTECKSEGALNDAMARWANGSLRLMIGHPACLHPETQVLTERRGWVRIVDVGLDDRVFDGVEFVSHNGCQYSGYTDVIDLFGITMTPNHKLLIQGKWKEAKDVQDKRDSRSQALFQWKAPPDSQGDMRSLWGGAPDDSSECNQGESQRAGTLRHLYQYHIPSHDPHSNMEHLAGIEVESQGYDRSELRGSGDHDVSRMGAVPIVSRGHGRELQGRPDNRENRREQAVQQSELSVGYQHGATSQQAQQQGADLYGRNDASCGTVQTQRVFQNDDRDATRQGDDSRRSGRVVQDVELRQESATRGHPSERKAHVYDLVNCGPRHRFVIRNNEGEMFISHNSMGHGVDGLQKRGHIVVWFGITWSLDLYEQMNARLRRQGQGVPVICHRIMMRDTLDQAQALALESKADTQQSLRNAIKEYRVMRGM
jgi:hypothetical protein